MRNGHLGGAGDKGRDVVGYLGDPQTACEWDSYQCKHYDHPLMPTDIYTELGKLCVYTNRGDFTVPRRYRFVAPRGVGVKLHDMLRNAEKLREALIGRGKRGEAGRVRYWESGTDWRVREVGESGTGPKLSGPADVRAIFTRARHFDFGPPFAGDPWDDRPTLGPNVARFPSAIPAGQRGGLVAHSDEALPVPARRRFD